MLKAPVHAHNLLCYTCLMHSSYWSNWERFLRRWGLHEPAAAILETSGALASLAAQAVYMLQPLFAHSGSLSAWEKLAVMLEDPQEARLFAEYLRREVGHAER